MCNMPYVTSATVPASFKALPFRDSRGSAFLEILEALGFLEVLDALDYLEILEVLELLVILAILYSLAAMA